MVERTGDGDNMELHNGTLSVNFKATDTFVMTKKLKSHPGCVAQVSEDLSVSKVLICLVSTI